MNLTKNMDERCEFARNGCSYAEFAEKFGMTEKAAYSWMVNHGFKADKVRKKKEESIYGPRDMVHAYYSLMAAILTDMTPEEAMRAVSA